MQTWIAEKDAFWQKARSEVDLYFLGQTAWWTVAGLEMSENQRWWKIAWTLSRSNHVFLTAFWFVIHVCDSSFKKYLECTLKRPLLLTIFFFAGCGPPVHKVITFSGSNPPTISLRGLCSRHSQKEHFNLKCQTMLWMWIHHRERYSQYCTF